MDMSRQGSLDRGAARHREYRRREIFLLTEEMSIVEEMDKDGWELVSVSFCGLTRRLYFRRPAVRR